MRRTRRRRSHHARPDGSLAVRELLQFGIEGHSAYQNVNGARDGLYQFSISPDRLPLVRTKKTVRGPLR